MMIEYITKTGMFGVFWVLITLFFPFITYKFIKRNPEKSISTFVPVSLILFLFHFTASELIGKSKFDMALTLIKDMWFLCYHVFFITIYLLLDKELFNHLFKKKFKVKSCGVE